MQRRLQHRQDPSRPRPALLSPTSVASPAPKCRRPGARRDRAAPVEHLGHSGKFGHMMNAWGSVFTSHEMGRQGKTKESHCPTGHPSVDCRCPIVPGAILFLLNKVTSLIKIASGKGFTLIRQKISKSKILN